MEVELEPAPGSGHAEVEAGGEREQGSADLRRALCEALAARLRTGLVDPYPATDLLARLGTVEVSAAGEEAMVLALEALDVACRRALEQARVTVLEPIMDLEIECPSWSLSGVLADLRGRGARIRSIDSGEGPARIEGAAPMRAMLGYATRLRSLTRGHGTVVLTPSGFRPIGEGEADPATASARQKEPPGLDPCPVDP